MTVYINKGIRSSTGPGTRQQQNAGRQKTLFLEIKERNTVLKFLLYFALKFQGRSRYGPRTTGWRCGLDCLGRECKVEIMFENRFPGKNVSYHWNKVNFKTELTIKCWMIELILTSLATESKIDLHIHTFEPISCHLMTIGGAFLCPVKSCEDCINFVIFFPWNWYNLRPELS